MSVFTDAEMNLWEEMAQLTHEKCIQKCHNIGACCNAITCGFVIDYAVSLGIVLAPTKNKNVPLLDENNRCIAPPHLRPLCSIHQCDISSVGTCVEDPSWTKKYFKIREKLDDFASSR
jgi:hypothetical protein